jgi:hypothetical protein
MKKALKTIAMATAIFTMTGCGLAEQIALVPFKVAAGVVVPAYEMGMVVAKVPAMVIGGYKNEKEIAHGEAVNIKIKKTQEQVEGKAMAAHLNQEQTAAW